MPDADRSESTAGSRTAPETEPLNPEPDPAASGAVSSRPDQNTAQDAQDRWLRAAADLENTRKRAARELNRARDRERVDVAGQFLPVVDNLELALAHAEADPTSIIEGVRAVLDQAVGVLTRLGYDRHDESGVPFDAATHEVVAIVDDPDAAPGTVVRVLRPGYGEAERQLRPMAVAVTRQRE